MDDLFGDAADAGGDHGGGACHGFEDGVGEIIGEGRGDEEIGGGVIAGELIWGDEADGAEVGEIGDEPAADGEEEEIGEAREDEIGEGFGEDVDAFAFVEGPAGVMGDESEDGLIFGDSEGLASEGIVGEELEIDAVIDLGGAEASEFGVAGAIVHPEAWGDDGGGGGELGVDAAFVEAGEEVLMFEEGEAFEVTDEWAGEAGGEFLTIPAGEEDIAEGSGVMEGEGGGVAIGDLGEESVGEIAVERVEVNEIGLEVGSGVELLGGGELGAVGEIGDMVAGLEAAEEIFGGAGGACGPAFVDDGDAGGFELA